LIHGQEIIAYLLETIIESNKMEMNIYEIEGDAVVFYSFDNNASPSRLRTVSTEILRKFKE